jgi:transcriptional regulator GlxA family with amidase domain
MHTFTIAALEGALGASTSITLDILRTANQIAESVNRPTITWQVIGSSAVTQMSNGMLIKAVPFSETSLCDRSTLVIPGLGLESPRYFNLYGHYRLDSSNRKSTFALIKERLEHDDIAQLAQLAHQYNNNGNVVAASCSSVLILGQAELLNGRVATTHWRLYDWFRKKYPKCGLDVTRMLVQDGTLITAGAAMSQMDLMLHLLRKTMGHEISDLTRRYLRMEGRPTLAQYMTAADLKNDDRNVVKLEKIVESHMPNVPPLKKIAEEMSVTEKTLSRRIKKATGMTPLSFIQHVRLRHAQHLLETTHLQLEEIASKVGYADATALRKLFLKNLGCTPGQLRAARGSNSFPEAYISQAAENHPGYFTSQ